MSGALTGAGIWYDMTYNDESTEQAVASNVGGFAASVATGAAVGTLIGGPVGTVAGVVVGGAVSVFTSGMIADCGSTTETSVTPRWPGRTSWSTPEMRSSTGRVTWEEPLSMASVDCSTDQQGEARMSALAPAPDPRPAWLRGLVLVGILLLL